MQDGLTVTHRIHFSLADKGRREIKPGPQTVRCHVFTLVGFQS